MAFNLGNNQNPGAPGGFSFGQPANAPVTSTAAPATGFSFGGAPAAINPLLSAAAPPATGSTFGLSAFSMTPSSTPAAGTFSLGTTPVASAPAPAAAAAPAGGFAFSSGGAPTTKPPLFGGMGGMGLNFGAPTTAPQAATPLSFGTPAPTPASVPLSMPTAALVAPTTSAPASSFSFGGGATLTPVSATPAASIPAPVVASVAPVPSLGTTSFGATPLQLSLSKPPVATAAPVAVPLPVASAAPTLSASLFGAKTTSAPEVPAATTVSTSTTSTAAATSSLPKMSYAMMEAEINKWAFQLEEQENIFIHQATQVNAWDRLLLDSGDKIANLNSTMEALKLEQQKLDLELDYIASQERELEDSIGPIETAITSMQLADPERQQTYEMAENLDAQTKQMANDLKKIINHLNIINKEQDENNPVVQVGRILNAHMNSLLWINQTASASQSQMEEASKMIDLLKKELQDHSSLMK